MDTSSQTSEALELTNEELITAAVNNGEGVIANNGAFSTETGERTGRSPNDRFIVKEPGSSNLIDWGDVNIPFEEDNFNSLWDKVETYLAEKDRYVSRVHVGSHSEHYLPVRVTTETAWHSFFARLIFVCSDTIIQITKRMGNFIGSKLSCDPDLMVQILRVVLL